MSFTASDLLRWLTAEGVSHALLRADGQPWSGESELAAVSVTSACIDSRKATAGALFVGVPGSHAHGASFLSPALRQGSVIALVEGGFAAVAGSGAPVVRVEDARAALAALARGYLRAFRPIVVGITGSNGKTTTKDMLRAALGDERRVGANAGNLNSGWGLPLAVLSQRGDEQVLVLEMGASEPGEIGQLAAIVEPSIGCITNIGSAHLAAFRDLQGVLQTKGELVARLPREGTAVLNRDDPSFDHLSARAAAVRVLTFGRAAESQVRLTKCQQRLDGLEVGLNERSARLGLFGEANGYNAAAACAMAAVLGVPIETSLARLAGTKLSPHRSRIVPVAGRVILDDCYNANPSSMRAALQSLAAMPARGQRIAVLGGMAELGPDSPALHQRVLQEARRLGIDRIVPVGEAMELASGEAFAPAGMGGGLSGEDLTAIGRLLAATTSRGDVVLFKASRSVALERALEALLAELGEGQR